MIHKHEHAKKKIKRGWLITGVVCVVLVALLGCGWLYYQGKLDLLQFDDGKREIDTNLELPLDGLDIPDMGEGPGGDDAKGNAATGEILKDEDVINILLLGTDERSKSFSDNARADSIMILSLNTRDHKIKLVSIERGIGVPVPGRNDDWITHTFRYGGAALTMQTVRDCFKVNVNHYIRINFHMFEEGIDAIGGIDLNLTDPEVNYMKEEGIQTVKTGLNHVDGEAALCYARMRKIDSDWKRIERQRTVVQAALNQVVSSDMLTINKLADTILPMIQTNLTKGEITKLILEAPEFLASGVQMEQMTVPTKDTCWNSVGKDGRKMIAVDFDANAKILNEFFYGKQTD